MAILTPNPRFIAPWVNGAALAYGVLETYAAGTTTPKVTYQDQAGTIPNSVSIDLDANGVSPYNVFISGAYKFVLKNSLGAIIYTVDNIVGYNQLDWTGLTATIAMLNATDTSCVLITADYTIQLSDRGKTFLVNAAGAAVNINLLAAPVATNGFYIVVKKVDASINAVNVNAAGVETIDGENTQSLTIQWDSIKPISDGGSYYIIAQDINAFDLISTGDVKITAKIVADQGWVMLNDGTIGNLDSNATTRANADTQELFDFIYATYANTICPIYDSSGALSTRTTATTDFTSLKALRLPQCVGRIFGVAGQAQLRLTFTAEPSTSILTTNNTRALDFYPGTPIQFTTTGTLPAGLSLATTYYVIATNLSAGQIQVATTPANATVTPPVFVPITTTGSGIHTLVVQNPTYTQGITTGESAHSLTPNENAYHVHPPAVGNFWTLLDVQNFDSGTGLRGAAALSTGPSGESLAHNNMQPTVFLNAMIKL